MKLFAGATALICSPHAHLCTPPTIVRGTGHSENFRKWASSERSRLSAFDFTRSESPPAAFYSLSLTKDTGFLELAIQILKKPREKSKCSSSKPVIPDFIRNFIQNLISGVPSIFPLLGPEFLYLVASGDKASTRSRAPLCG